MLSQALQNHVSECLPLNLKRSPNATDNLPTGSRHLVREQGPVESQF